MRDRIWRRRVLRARAFRRASAAVLVILVAGFLGACGSDGDTQPADQGDPLLAEGRSLYEENCSVCHGVDLQGTDAGPPFLSEIYAPNHHPDGSFYVAVEKGVQPHHWEFGPMPPQPSVTPEDVAAIVAYVRSQQVQAGITEDPSHR
jgi:mono/diheme cytochrome c family protein